MKITTTVPTDQCPCKGERRWGWHVSRGLEQCEAAKAAKKEARRPFHQQWKAGTSILVPEIDPL